MYLTSKSGYAMPFDDKGDQVEMLLPFGTQTHPKTGKEFFHHGVDLKAHYYMLVAVADGKVTGIGTDSTLELYVDIAYEGGYTVRYAHLSNLHVMFGQNVKAGTAVAVSGADLLHLSVSCHGEEIDPIEFITMLYANVRSWNTNQGQGRQEFVSFDVDVHTDYDADKEEIEQLMMAWFPAYFGEILDGSYKGGEHIKQQLSRLFQVGQLKQFFMETLPSAANPLGISSRAAVLASKAQNLLISDFLNYLALRQNIFLSSMGEAQKKNLKRKPVPTKES